MKRIEKLLYSKRVSFSVLMEYMPIPDLLYIIEEYRAECEGHNVYLTIPSAQLVHCRDFSECWESPLLYDQVTGVIYVHVNGVSRGYNLLGQRMDAFPSGRTSDRRNPIVDIVNQKLFWVHNSSPDIDVNIETKFGDYGRYEPIKTILPSIAFRMTVEGIWFVVARKIPGLYFEEWESEHPKLLFPHHGKIWDFLPLSVDFYYVKTSRHVYKVVQGVSTRVTEYPGATQLNEIVDPIRGFRAVRKKDTLQVYY
jgi:hypothetical protein